MIKNLAGKAAHELLLQLKAETAHNIGKWGMKRGLFAPGPYRTPGSETELFGFTLDNPLILAAGFDKNGELADRARDYGFALVEEGSITYEGGEGNEKPRLFRIRGSDGKISLLNRMGLNGKPAEEVVETLSSARNPFAVNIAKTHSPEIVGDDAIDDMTSTYELIERVLIPLGKVVYVTWNLSCPNTSEGKTFEESEPLKELIAAAHNDVGKLTSWVFKLSPGLTRERLEKIFEVTEPFADGYIISNTKPFQHPTYRKGGLSGPAVHDQALKTIRIARSLTDKVIIGCGGLETGRDLLKAEEAGANFFQAFNGFVVGPNAGPNFAHRVLNEYYGLKQTEKILY